jgi:hypothetical protein
MAYPSFAQLVGSSLRHLSDRVVTRDTGGTARASSYYDAVKRAFTVKHLLTTADLATLEAYYAANQTASFDFTWSLNGTTYTCIFGAGGLRVQPGAVHHDVTVELEQV